MNWISNFVRPKIDAIFSKKESAQNLWIKCDHCDSRIFNREFKEELNVCSNCGHHMYISPKDRFESLLDNRSYTLIDYEKPIIDPLKFKDSKKYSDRLRDAQKQTGEEEAILVSSGKLGGKDVVVACQDFKFMGGSMGSAVGNAILSGVSFFT